MDGYTYECDDCEDIEFYGEILSNGFIVNVTVIWNW